MTVPLKIGVEKPLQTHTLPTKIPLAGTSFDVLQEEDSFIIIDLNLSFSLDRHIEALNKEASHSKFFVWQEPKKVTTVPVMAALDLKTEDMPSLCEFSLTIPVWASIFKKPPPVFDMNKWAESQQFDNFVYVPNCTKHSSAQAEDCTSNSNYTQVMLNAYQSMCETNGINPVVCLPNDRTKRVLSLSTFDAVQPGVEGQRVAGLAGSSLLDFDDSKYARDYLTAITALAPEKYSREPARRTVLAKSEFILAGRFSHTYNQRFVKGFLEALSRVFHEEFSCAFKDKETEVQTTLVGIMRNMVMSGLVLVDEYEDFERRLWALNLGGSSELIMKIYRSVGEPQ